MKQETVEDRQILGNKAMAVEGLQRSQLRKTKTATTCVFVELIESAG